MSSGTGTTGYNNKLLTLNRLSRTGSSSRFFAYSKMEMEDPEEVKHRRAQFLIYKTMQQVDSIRRRPSWLKVKTSKLKFKIGKRLKKLRKTLLFTISSAAQPDGGVVYKQLLSQFRALRTRLFRNREAINVALTPIFTWSIFFFFFYYYYYYYQSCVDMGGCFSKEIKLEYIYIYSSIHKLINTYIWGLFWNLMKSINLQLLVAINICMSS